MVGAAVAGLNRDIKKYLEAGGVCRQAVQCSFPLPCRPWNEPGPRVRRPAQQPGFVEIASMARFQSETSRRIWSLRWRPSAPGRAHPAALRRVGQARGTARPRRRRGESLAARFPMKTNQEQSGASRDETENPGPRAAGSGVSRRGGQSEFGPRSAREEFPAPGEVERRRLGRVPDISGDGLELTGPPARVRRPWRQARARGTRRARTAPRVFGREFTQQVRNCDFPDRCFMLASIGVESAQTETIRDFTVPNGIPVFSDISL